MPLKDFGFKDEKLSIQQSSSLMPKFRPEKQTYLQNQKLKFKLNKEVYTNEFKDLQTKVEPGYANYLHEQTRKIFLHDLEALKQKIFGSPHGKLEIPRQHLINRPVYQELSEDA